MADSCKIVEIEKCHNFHTLQIESVSPEGQGATKMMIQRIRKMKEKIPELFDIDEVLELYPVTYENSLNNVLRLEVTR